MLVLIQIWLSEPDSILIQLSFLKSSVGSYALQRMSTPGDSSDDTPHVAAVFFFVFSTIDVSDYVELSVDVSKNLNVGG